jgi:hypothetical protein
MAFKNMTPASFIVTALEQYVKTHAQATLTQVLENDTFDELRASASGFALKEYSVIALKERDLSYEVVDGALVFFKHGIKVCTIDPEAVSSIKMSCDRDKTKIYRKNKLDMTLNRSENDKDTYLARIYAINLILYHNKISEGIKNAGLSNESDNEQVAFIA